MVHLFWVQNVQASFNQDLCCYFKHKGLKTIFTNLVTCPKLLLVGFEKCNSAFLRDKAACSFSLHCFCPVDIVWLVKEKYLGEKPFSNRSVTSAKVMEGNGVQKVIIGVCIKGNIRFFRCKVSQSDFLRC